jgi:hypothetical protein
MLTNSMPPLRLADFRCGPAACFRTIDRDLPSRYERDQRSKANGYAHGFLALVRRSRRSHGHLHHQPGELLFSLERLVPGRRRTELDGRETVRDIAVQRLWFSADENDLWIVAMALVLDATLVARWEAFSFAYRSPRR